MCTDGICVVEIDIKLNLSAQHIHLDDVLSLTGGQGT